MGEPVSFLDFDGETLQRRIYGLGKIGQVGDASGPTLPIAARMPRTGLARYSACDRGHNAKRRFWGIVPTMDADRADAAPETLYRRLGAKTLQRIVAEFYSRIPTDPLLSPMYPPDDLAGAERRLRSFLAFRLGGPKVTKPLVVDSRSR